MEARKCLGETVNIILRKSNITYSIVEFVIKGDYFFNIKVKRLGPLIQI